MTPLPVISAHGGGGGAGSACVVALPSALERGRVAVGMRWSTCLARLARVAFAVCGGGTWMPDPGEPCPGFALRPARGHRFGLGDAPFERRLMLRLICVLEVAAEACGAARLFAPHQDE